MTRIAAMHVVDSLAAGGTERMAVNLVNCLPRDRYIPFLCTTRKEGPLAALVAQDVGRLQLGRKHTVDASALRRLVSFNRRNNVRILHAHSTSLFLAVAAARFAPRPAVIWHDHAGRFEIDRRRILFFRPFVRSASAVISVSNLLARWAIEKLIATPEKVRCIPNFVSASACESPAPGLPGTSGSRVVCVASLRPQKDHPTLLRAMAIVARRQPAAHLLLAGAATDPACLDAVNREIAALDLSPNVTILGERSDVPAILKACDIGVLSSLSEGLPLSLIEYGFTGLPVVSTSVGQCPEALDFGRAGILVPPASPEALASALLTLLESPGLRSELGQRLRTRAQARYSSTAVIEQVCQVYEMVLGHAPVADPIAS